MARSPRRMPIAFAAAVAWLALIAGTALPVRGGGHAIEISDFAFAPATLTIAVGETVTWTNADPVVHTATASSGAFDSGDLDTGESYSVTFTEPGTYDYLCTPHPSMTGTIVVESAAPAPSVPMATASAAPPSGGGSLPDVAMAAPGPSALQVAGMTLLILSAVATGLIAWGRRAR